MCADGAQVWDLTAGRALSTLAGHPGGVAALDLHPHEFLLASGGADRTVRYPHTHAHAHAYTHTYIHTHTHTYTHACASCRFFDLEKMSSVCVSGCESSRVRCVTFAASGALYSAGEDSLRVRACMHEGWGRGTHLSVSV